MRGLLWATVVAVVAGTAEPVSGQERVSRRASFDEARKLEASGALDEALSAYDAFAERFPDDWRGFMLRGQLRFRLGENEGALQDFDRVVALAPGQEPYLWQRGISQYYAGDDEGCIAQFELHRTVNPDDVENAVWHFLCYARRNGVEAAQEKLLPVGPDRRAPMPTIYEMFRGEASHAKVEQDARRAGGSLAAFYASLYIGLYRDALGDADSAVGAIRAAAEADTGGYMRDVARFHLKQMLSRRN